MPGLSIYINNLSDLDMVEAMSVVREVLTGGSDTDTPIKIFGKTVKVHASFVNGVESYTVRPIKALQRLEYERKKSKKTRFSGRHLASAGSGSTDKPS